MRPEEIMTEDEMKRCSHADHGECWAYVHRQGRNGTRTTYRCVTRDCGRPTTRQNSSHVIDEDFDHLHAY